MKILVINPGSTSTKVGVFEDETLLFEETLRHPTEEIAKYASVIDQKDFRKEIILDFLKEKNCDPKTLNVIVGRGGLLKPIPGGTYAVSDALLADLKAGVQGQHASNLGGILAREIGDSLGVPSYIVDPVVVDELTDKARISGMPELPRRSIFHALNQKAVARRFAKENGKRYEDLNLIVIHMGGGVSVGAHDHGKVVDVNNILDGEGCFSPERSGTVPVGDLVKMCFSGKYTQKEVYKKICGNGGFNGYLHTNDAREVGKMAESGDALAKRFESEHFGEMETPVLFNCLGHEKADSDSIPALLEKQVQSSVYMEDTLRRLGELGVTDILEVGPGKALSGFVKKTLGADVHCTAVETAEELEAFLTSWKEAQA